VLEKGMRMTLRFELQVYACCLTMIRFNGDPTQLTKEAAYRRVPLQTCSASPSLKITQ
jgi:hypothetical protein